MLGFQQSQTSQQHTSQLHDKDGASGITGDIYSGIA